MRARIYTRVSRVADGRSTKSQEIECRAWCKAHEHEVVAVYTDDGKGASRHGKKRVAWEALKGDLEPGDLLVAWEASRNTRDMAEYIVLRELCLTRSVQLAYSGRVIDLSEPDDSFVTGLDFLLAEREAGKIRQRVMRGQKTSRAEGRPHTRPPWGYRIKEVEGVRVRGVWEPDPVEAPRVREAVMRLLSGHTQFSVHRWLETTGWAPSSPTYLQTAVASPVYAGRRVHKGEVVGKGTWEPLITEDQHEALTQRMHRMKSTYGWHHPPGQEPKYLLSGIAVCGTCEEGLRHTRLGGRGHFYQCGRFGHVCRTMEPMDKAAEDALFEWAMRIDWTQHDTEDPGIAVARQEMEQLEDELRQWRQLAKDRKVTPVAFAENEQSLLTQIEAARPKATGRLLRLSGIDFEHLDAAWSMLSMRQKREIIRAALTIRAVPGSRTRRDGKLMIDEV